MLQNLYLLSDLGCYVVDVTGQISLKETFMKYDMFSKEATWAPYYMNKMLRKSLV